MFECKDEELRRYAQKSRFGRIGLKVIAKTREAISINRQTPITVVCNYNNLLRNARECSLAAGANEYFCPIEMEGDFCRTIS